MKPRYDFDHTTGAGQKRLMAISAGMDSETYIRGPINLASRKDHGCDPLGDGKFRMVPSGDIVDYAERCRRLERD